MAASTKLTRTERIEAALATALRPENATGGEDTLKIRVCAGTTCNASGRAELTAALADELARRGLTDKVNVVETGCHGLCQEGPIVVVHPRGVFYPRLKARDIKAIVETSVVGDDVVERLLYRDPATDQPIELEKDIPFYARQVRVARAINGFIDPTSIDDYLARGGYASLAKVLVADDPVAVIDEVELSGLRGRGGAGFPAGKKWRYCRENPGARHYIICNGDEGDPGAFMDRAVLEDNPHSVIEGMLIAAFAIGADEGYIYVRHEYPLAVARLRHALEQARERGPAGQRHPGHRLELRPAHQPGRRRLRLRRIDRPHGLDRRPPRHAARQAHPHGGPRPLRRAHQPEQRRDLRHRALDHHPRRQGLRGHGHRHLEGHQDLLAHRQGA